MRHLNTPWELPQNLLFDDFETHWIHTQLDPAARRSLNEGWQGGLPALGPQMSARS